MNKIETIEQAISEIGLTNLANLLSDQTGKEFSTQQVQNWRTRGVPYKWQDAFNKATDIPKDSMRKN